MKATADYYRQVQIVPQINTKCRITALAQAHSAFQDTLAKEELAAQPNMWLISFCRRKMAEAQAILVMADPDQATLINRDIIPSDLATDESFGLKIKSSIRLQEKP